MLKAFVFHILITYTKVVKWNSSKFCHFASKIFQLQLCIQICHLKSFVQSCKFQEGCKSCQQQKLTKNLLIVIAHTKNHNTVVKGRPYSCYQDYKSLQLMLCIQKLSFASGAYKNYLRFNAILQSFIKENVLILDFEAINYSL